MNEGPSSNDAHPNAALMLDWRRTHPSPSSCDPDVTSLSSPPLRLCVRELNFPLTFENCHERPPPWDGVLKRGTHGRRFAARSKTAFRFLALSVLYLGEDQTEEMESYDVLIKYNPMKLSKLNVTAIRIDTLTINCRAVHRESPSAIQCCRSRLCSAPRRRCRAKRYFFAELVQARAAASLRRTPTDFLHQL